MQDKKIYSLLNSYIYDDLFCPFLNDLRRLNALVYKQDNFVCKSTFSSSLNGYYVVGSSEMNFEKKSSSFDIRIFYKDKIIYDLNNNDRINLKKLSMLINIIYNKLLMIV